jgi:hypothetical protein
MKVNLIKYYFLVLMSLPVVVLASGGTDTDVISSLYVSGSWTMVALPKLANAEKGSKNNPDSCESTSYYATVPSEPNYNAIHSTLMAAQMSGKKVFFWVNGCGGQGGNYPRIVSVWLQSN